MSHSIGRKGAILLKGSVLAQGLPLLAAPLLASANLGNTDNRKPLACAPVRIGAYCWIGAHAAILPGVSLGSYRIVGAGAAVPKSFDAGYQVIAGNRARVIRSLNPAKCIWHRSEEEFHGDVAAADFPKHRQAHLATLQ